MSWCIDCHHPNTQQAVPPPRPDHHDGLRSHGDQGRDWNCPLQAEYHTPDVLGNFDKLFYVPPMSELRKKLDLAAARARLDGNARQRVLAQPRRTRRHPQFSGFAGAGISTPGYRLGRRTKTLSKAAAIFSSRHGGASLAFGVDSGPPAALASPPSTLRHISNSQRETGSRASPVLRHGDRAQRRLHRHPGFTGKPRRLAHQDRKVTRSIPDRMGACDPDLRRRCFSSPILIAPAPSPSREKLPRGAGLTAICVARRPIRRRTGACSAYRVRPDGRSAEYHQDALSTIESGIPVGTRRSAHGACAVSLQAFGFLPRATIYKCANVVVSLDSGFPLAVRCGPWYRREFSAKRRVVGDQKTMNGLYMVQPNPTATGSKADYQCSPRASEGTNFCFLAGRAVGLWPAMAGGVQSKVQPLDQRHCPVISRQTRGP